MIASHRRRHGNIRHAMLGITAALAVGIPIASLFIVSSIARERERTIAAIAEIQRQTQSRQAADAEIAKLNQRASDLELALAKASFSAIQNDLESKKATEEIESLKRQAIALRLAMEEREKRIRGLNRDFGEWYLPQVVTAGVISVEGNRVELDLGRDNRLQLGRLFRVYRRAGSEVRLIGAIRLTEIFESRSFGLFEPANDVDWVQPGDEASDR
jgi:hypothetical protein